MSFSQEGPPLAIVPLNLVEIFMLLAIGRKAGRLKPGVVGGRKQGVWLARLKSSSSDEKRREASGGVTLDTLPTPVLPPESR